MPAEPPKRPLAERVDPNRTALVIVDMQNDFCHAAGHYATVKRADVSAMPALAERIAGLLAQAREQRLLILFVRAVYGEAVLSPALKEHNTGQCREGTWGANWYGGLVPDESAPNEVVITKHRFSAFWGSSIDLYLRSNGIENVIVAGTLTSGCVESTVRDAFFNDYFVTVPEDCVFEATMTRHEASLEKMGKTFGITAPAARIVEAWRARRDNSGARPWQVEQKRARMLPDLQSRIRPEHTALVMIDMQNDFCHPDGAIGRRGEDLSFIQSSIPHMQALLESARRAGVRVIHVRAEYGAASASDVSLATGVDVGATACCAPGTWGAEIIDAVKPLPNEPVVVKHRFSGFTDTRLEMILRSLGIRTVVMAGVATQCCVEATARDAALKDFYLVVPRDGVAARTRMRHLHEASLETMALYFGLVVPVSEIESAWSKAARGDRAAE